MEEPSGKRVKVAILRANTLPARPKGGIFQRKQPPKAQVQIISGEGKYNTAAAKRSATPAWNEDFHITVDGFATVQLFHSGKKRSIPLGKVSIDLSKYAEGEEQSLVLLDENGNSAGNVSIRVTTSPQRTLDEPSSVEVQSPTDVVPHSVEVPSPTGGVPRRRIGRAEDEPDSEDELGSKILALNPLMDKTAQIETNLRVRQKEIIERTGDVARGGSMVTSLASSLIPILQSIEGLVGVFDQLSQIHPFVSVAWGAVSAVYKATMGQLARDELLHDVLRDVKVLYWALMDLDDGRKKQKGLAIVINKLLRETVIFMHFVGEYGKRGFMARAVLQPWQNTDNRLGDFQRLFAHLQRALQTVSTIHSYRTITHITTDIRQFQNLSDLNPVDMNAAGRPMCLQETRLGVLNDLFIWFENVEKDAPQVLWLTGVAGAGKSTISTSISELYNADDDRAAFLFFDRNNANSNPKSVIRTLAHQLARYDERIGKKISEVLQNRNGVLGSSFLVQLESLVVDPLIAFSKMVEGHSPILIALDALDECGSPRERAELLRTLADGFGRLPSFVRVLITSRPESDIEDAFGKQPYLQHIPLDLDKSKEDVATFIRKELKELRAMGQFPKDLAEDWPGEVKTDALIGQANGLFVWASTACAFLKDVPAGVDDVLDRLLAVKVDGEAMVDMDRLYATALRSKKWERKDVKTNYVAFLGMILSLQKPMTAIGMDALLRSRFSSESMYQEFKAILTVNDKMISTSHASFGDYITDVERCTDEGKVQPWFIDLPSHRAALGEQCLRLLDNKLHENMGNLTLQLNPGSSKLEEAVAYACLYWIDHVTSVNQPSAELGSLLDEFLHRHLLHWFEGLSLLKQARSIIPALDRLQHWTRENLPNLGPLNELVYDAWRFAQQFASLLEDHPLLVYHSALPFSPPQTRLYRHFIPQTTHSIVRNTRTWSPRLLQIPAHDDDVHYVDISPDGSTIISLDSGDNLRVWDAITGANQNDIAGSHLSRCVFSPDGTKIAAIQSGKEILFWDSNNLDPLPSIKIPDDRVFQSFSISANGKFVLASSWAHEGANKVKEGHDGGIYLWNLEGREPKFTLKVEEEQAGVSAVCFSPDGSCFLSGSQGGDIRLWDISAKEIFHFKDSKAVNQLAWAPDGQRFATSSALNVRVWDVKTRTQLWEKSVSIVLSCLCFAPNNLWITCVGDVGKRLETLDAATGESVFQNPPQPPIQFAAYSRDSKKLIVGKCGDGRRGKDVEVWDVDLVRQRPVATGVQPSNGTVVISPDGQRAAFQGQVTKGEATKGRAMKSPHRIRVVDTQNGENVMEPWAEPLRMGVSHFVFSSDSSHLATWGVGSKGVRLFNVETHAELELLAHGDHPKMVGFSSDGSKLVLATKYDNEVFDVSSREMVYHTEDPASMHFYAILSPDGTHCIYTGSATAFLVQVATGAKQELQSYTERMDPNFVFSPDGTQVMAMPQGESLDIDVWHTSDGSRVFPAIPTWSDGTETSPKPPAVFYSPDGTIIVARGASKVAAWDARTGQSKQAADLREYFIEDGWIFTSYRCEAGEKRRITKLPEDGNWALVAQRQNMLVFVSTFENELIFLHLQDD